MPRIVCRASAFLTALLAVLVVVPAAGQGRRRPQAPPAKPAIAAAQGADSLNNLKFRNLGPAVAGGRVSAVVGAPGHPNAYYVGAAAGGVWKTSDGGNSWEAVFEDQPTASIGAIALAPSNPNLVWVGTGESKLRNDIVDGRGVFFSPDAGKTWKSMGLDDVGQISRIVIDPTNPDIVFVGAIGHAWAPNRERGVYRTADGGKTWQKVLFVNDTTGVADLIMVSGNPRVLFAAMWQVVRRPWELTSGGPGSGIYRSKDGGLTWDKLTEGLPSGLMGRIALAVGPTNPNHIYALIESKQGTLWDSKDLGDHWIRVSDFRGLSTRPFYFSRMEVSPADDRKVFFLSYQLLLSEDGGKTTRNISRGVHVDHHSMWIDPQNPDRMLDGNDGGVYLTQDGGKTWRFLNNLPIAQFYMVAADNNAPYMLCGGLQDNNAWCGMSAGPGGAGGGGGGGGVGGGLTGSEWFPVSGGDGEYVVPAPSDSTIVYLDTQNGNISRVNLKTGVTRSIRPYLVGVQETRPANLRYRFNWTSPIEVSPTDANTVLFGGNVVFKTTDGGEHWTVLSPDLTRDNKAKQVTSGGPINYDISGAETYHAILTINLAPTDTSVIWVGSDDGLVHVTRDGGKAWTNVAGRFPGLRPDAEGRVYQIGVSPFDPGTAYLAIDRHQLDDRRPYVYRTGDYGKTWSDISRGLPGDVPARVVRENPNVRGFLVLGTDAALWYSRDAGATWKSLRAGFPTAPVYDLKFIKRSHDLVVATHGRGLFVLDNITALEELSPEVAASDFHVFTTLPAQIRVRPRRTGVAPSRFTAPNPPAGAMIDYYLRAAFDTTGPEPRGPGEQQQRSRRGRVIVTVTDGAGDTVVVDSSAPGKQGVNRHVWNLRYAGPTRLTFERPTGVEEESPFRSAGAPRAVPGTYTVTASAGDKRQTGTVIVEPDPILGGDPARFAAQLRAGLEWRNAMSALNEMLNRIVSLETQLRNVQQALRDNSRGDTAGAAPVMQQGRELGRKLKDLKDSLYNSEVQRDAGQDQIHYHQRFQDRLQSAGFGLAFAYAQPPTEVQAARMKELRAALDGYLGQFNELLRSDVAAFNKTAQERQAPVLVAGQPIEVKLVSR
ncbi:MAG TPA: hypothetical protein VFU41_07905 [Gemmatimonadales bacterium]|nr:hypothetical protein [Gemmatimonadales bacterium]